MKHILTFTALVFATACFGQVPDYVPTDGLVAWYPFDGSLIDASGMVGEGVASGTFFGLDRWSNEGSALQVVSGSFANLGMQDQLTLSPEDNLTIAMWSHPDSQENLSVTKYQNGNGSGSSWFVQDGFDSGVRVFGNGTSGTPNEDEWYQTCPNITDGWSHIVVVFEGGSVTLWVNGILICQTTMPVSTSTQSQPVLVGRSNCTNGSACNHSEGRVDDLGFWNRALSGEEALQLFLGAAAVYGCMDSEACNFNPEANVNDGSCYSCEIPAAHCGGGTYWDTESQSCVIANPSDTDFDGCVGMTDLLDLLSVFGTCNETPWSCGDPLEYQGHDYETVLIGEQCWFAENLRSENYKNGDVILGDLSNEEWVEASNSMIGAQAFFDNNESHLLQYGRLYNQYAVNDERGLCPTGWYVPSDGEFMTLELELGMNEDEVTLGGWRGSNQGDQMKSSSEDVPSWDGTNSSGFAAVPGGNRRSNGGSFHDLIATGYLWTSSPNLSRRHFTGYSGVSRYTKDAGYGFSIRCLKDSE